MKGNFTDSIRETSHLTALTETYANQCDEYKKFATARKKNLTYTQEQITEYYDKMMAYVEESEHITIAGCILAMGINPRAFSRMRSGEFDYRLEQFCAENGYTEADFQYDHRDIPYVVHDNEIVMMIDYAELIELFMLFYMNQAELQVLTNKPVGGIFVLKSQFQWRDNDNHEPLHTEPMVVASKEKALEIMKMLAD